MNKKSPTFLIHILPESALKQELLEVDPATTAAILCSDEHNIELLPNMLVISFSDTTDKKQVNAITIEQAREIINFVKGLSINIQDLYISCSAGESRSPGIAAGILRMCGRNDKDVWDNPFYVPNSLVYQTLCREFGLFAPDWYVQSLVERNRQCYLEAVKNGNSCKYEKWQIIE